MLLYKSCQLKLNALLQERLRSDFQTTKSTIPETSKASGTSSIPVRMTSVEVGQSSEPAFLSASPKLSAPLFKKKTKLQEEPQSGIDKAKPTQDGIEKNGEAKNAKTDEVNKLEKVNTIGNGHQGPSQRPSNPFFKSSNNQEKLKADEANQVRPQRPSNPFCKSSVK